MLRQKKITMIICLLMLIVISGCESSKKRNVPDTNQRNQEKPLIIRTLNIQPLIPQR